MVTPIKNLFTSEREKKLWIITLLIVAAIFGTLFLGQPLEQFLRSQDVQAVLFLTGMIMVTVSVVGHGLKKRPSTSLLAAVIGLAAVYLMFFFRLGAPERSHLIEYSALAVVLHEVLLERSRNSTWPKYPVLAALVLGVLIGAFDEGLQWCFPLRRFDPLDIIFNSSAVAMALGASLILRWVRKKFSNPR